MAAKRGRPKIKPVVKNTIYSYALKHKDTPRQALAVELRHLIEEMGEIVPSEETMIKLISQRRNHPDSPTDVLWSLGSLPEYPIPIDALPMVMSICVRRIMQYDDDDFLTIREALWVARLYKLIELNKPKHIPPDVQDAIRSRDWKDENSWPLSELASEITVEDLVDDYAWAYAQYEILSEIEGEPFYSSELDVHISSDVYEYWGERRGDAIYNIVVDYGLDHFDYYKLLTLNLPISDIEEFVKSGKYKKGGKS